MTEIIVVTGATGNVGRALVERLGVAGVVPRVVSRTLASWRVPVDRVVGDLADPAVRARVFDGATRVFVSSMIDREAALDHDVLAAAVAAGARHLVKLSTISAEGDHAIGKRHRAHERAIEAAGQRAGLTWAFVRPGFFMSNVLQWRAALRAGNAVTAPAADGPFAPISPRDIAEVSGLALLAPAAHAGKIYALTGAEILTLRDEIAILGRILGRELTCNAVSPDAAAAAARAAGRPEAIVHALHQFWTSQAAGQAATRTSTFAELTGHPPETFETWARAFAPSAFAAAPAVGTDAHKPEARQ